MGKWKEILIVCLIVLVFPSSVLTQVKFSGYFSFEYLKSQAAGIYPEGTFGNLYGGLMASGTISGPLTFLTEVQARSQENFSLRQAYVSFQGSRLFKFKLGLFEIPFGQYNAAARPFQNLTVLTPLPFHFFPARWNDLGFCWEGNFSLVYFSTYIINGLSADDQGYLQSTIKDVNKNKGAGGRLGLRFGEGVELGGSFYSGKYDSSGSKNIQFEGLDLIWVTPEWEVRGEYIKSIYDHPTLNQKKDFDGYYLIVSMIIKKFRPYFSYQKSALPQWVIDDQNAPALNIFLENMVEKRRIALGFKLDILDNFFAKFEYDWNKEKNIAIKDNSLSVQAGFVF
ncbi:MAG: hypothetical protein JHC32_06360 [Candidatus Aminicenantes bacterium]|jgi:hypothetical protein|nr:hypothetical protein [Candidatus Aminicenantes bacterium]